MAITNHANPTTANAITYVFPATTITVGTTTPQQKPAAAIGGSVNAMPTPPKRHEDDYEIHPDPLGHYIYPRQGLERYVIIIIFPANIVFQNLWP